MVIDIDDMASSAESSANNGGAEADDGGSSSGPDALEQAVEQIGGNYESVKEYVDENGRKEDVMAFYERLANDDELWALMEDYRRKIDQKRILSNWMYDMDADFEAWRGEFWGDSDDPEPGTFNAVQQAARDSDGNLMWYKAAFPEPVEDFWEGEAVLFAERPGDDSHIYVTEEWVDTYDQFAKDVPGVGVRPMPPGDSEIGDAQSGGSGGSDADESTEIDAPFAIDTYPANDAQKKIREGWALGELKKLRKLEVESDKTKAGGRKTVRNLLDKKIEGAREGDESGGSDEQATLEDASDSDGMSDEEFAGKMCAETGEDPSFVKGVVEAADTHEEAREILGA